MHANLKMKREVFNMTGTCTGGRCVGWNALNAMWATAFDIDKERGTDYHLRLKNWLNEVQKGDLTIAGALTDPKGDRTKSPSQQDDPDMNLHIVERKDNGIVVRGAKVQICGIAAANEVFVLPGSKYEEPDEDYAVSFVIPRDIEGLKCIETRHPSDMRDFEEGYDNPVETGGITQSWLLFEDVFIPNERVFMAGEHQFSLNAVLNFITPYRAAIGACVAGQGDTMMGAAALLARTNGLNDKVFMEKFVQMAMNNETTFGMGIASASLGKLHESGLWQCDPLLSNINKLHVARLPYETKVLTQDIGGGIAETGCMPSFRDLRDEEYGELLRKYLKAGNASWETRGRVARLIEWLTLGAGVPGCMHGGGSPDGAKLMIRNALDLEKKVETARKLAGVEEDVKALKKK
jgi:4-hydroxybutyryl-CoA dehydratase/vinylacetyl-CoA-Delta-isomerase